MVQTIKAYKHRKQTLKAYKSNMGTNYKLNNIILSLYQNINQSVA